MSAFNTEHGTTSSLAPPPPSRPPSRVAAIPESEREDRDLQQAMAMSLGQDLGDQETGVVTSQQQPNFRRIGDEHYHHDNDDWAMTLFNASAQEIVLSPDPQERKRVDDEPPFLRPSQEGGYLGGIITILHSIPLAREALLLRDHSLSNYGHDAQWWNGQTIHLPRVVSVHDTHGLSGDLEDTIHETQRLMAFLDSTERAFGSVDSLAGIDSLSSDMEGIVTAYLEKWRQAALHAVGGDNPLANVFSSVALKRPFSVEDTPTDHMFSCLDPVVDVEHGQTLYDVLDSAIWPDRVGDELDDVWIEELADVLTIKLDCGDPSEESIDVKVPATFFPDRYMGWCRDISRKCRARRLQIFKDINEVESVMRYLAVAAPPGLRSTQILEKAAAAVPVAYSYYKEDKTRNSEHLVNELKTLTARLENKLNGKFFFLCVYALFCLIPTDSSRLGIHKTKGTGHLAQRIQIPYRAIRVSGCRGTSVLVHPAGCLHTTTYYVCATAREQSDNKRFGRKLAVVADQLLGGRCTNAAGRTRKVGLYRSTECRCGRLYGAQGTRD